MNRCHISGTAMKLFILLTFCLGFIVCGDRIIILVPPTAPLEYGITPLESGNIYLDNQSICTYISKINFVFSIPFRSISRCTAQTKKGILFDQIKPKIDLLLPSKPQYTYTNLGQCEEPQNTQNLQSLRVFYPKVTVKKTRHIFQP